MTQGEWDRLVAKAEEELEQADRWAELLDNSEVTIDERGHLNYKIGGE